MAPFDGRPVAALATGSDFLNFQNTDSIIVEESKPIMRLTAGFRQQERCHRACNQLKIPTSVLLVSCLRNFKAMWAAFLLCGQLLLVLVQPASNSTSNNHSFLVSLHESFASNALFSLSKSFLNP
ncbi:hypothetical protein PIB30_066296 [Stylosanthes scabra]|uniref:Uncharacterized protein n=1 Tax=Stylosanthes scabra TaxID=79078 RepID=A0ABU6QMR9_9FABA|nr:hypothetical protein [Stylosanthes scabra]